MACAGFEGEGRNCEEVREGSEEEVRVLEWELKVEEAEYVGFGSTGPNA